MELFHGAFQHKYYWNKSGASYVPCLVPTASIQTISATRLTITTYSERRRRLLFQRNPVELNLNGHALLNNPTSL